jgi:hypothetical protein
MLTRRNLLKNSGIAALAAVSSELWIPMARAQSTFDYFIAPNGDDNNNGLTPATAWSITALNTKQSTYAGKNIGIIGDVGGVQTPYQYGTVGGVQTTLYSIANHINSTASGDQCVIVVNGGNSGANTYLGSCASSGVYKVAWAIIDLANSGGTAPVGQYACAIGQWFYQNPSPVANEGHVTFDGLVVRNANYSGINMGDTKPGLTNIIIKNCKVYNCICTTSANNPGGIVVANHTGTQILNCLILNCTTSGGTEFPEGMGGIMSYSGLGMIVTNCTISGCGMSIYMKDSHQYGTFSYNYLDCGTFGNQSNAGIGVFSLMGIVPGTGQTLTVHHNIIIGNGWRGYGMDHLQVTGAANFYNNTFYANTVGASGGAVVAAWWDPTTGAGPFQWSNNLVYYPGVAGTNNGSWTGALSFNPPTGITASQVNYNYYGTGMTFGTSGPLSYAAWRGLGYDVNSVSGGSPFSGTPTSLNINSFQITGPATTAGRNGVACGALDGSGQVGCNFALALVPVAPVLTIS